MEILSKSQLEELYTLCFAESKKKMSLLEFNNALSAMLGLGEEETKRMFLKIDADNDGAVSWEEFSSHIIALGQSKRYDNVYATTSVKILEENINRGLEKSVDHTMIIEVATYIASNQWRPDIEKYITCTRDGVVKVWSGSTGHPMKSNITLQGPSAYVLAIAPLCKYNVVAISSNDHKIRFFSYEPRLRLDLEYDCGNSQAMAMECFSVEEKASDRKDSKSWTLTSYLVWGDDQGCLHFVLEDCLMELRSATAAPCVDASRVKKTNPEKQFTRNFFNGWVTRIEFLTGFSSTGILVASSNDSTVVTLSPDSWQVLTKFQGHKFAVKSFAWCKQYKCIASSGLDRDIFLWDITSAHKTGRMRGHQSPVLHMIYYEKQDHLFSLDQRYYLNVWDVSKQSLITRINTDEGDPFVDYHGLRAGCLLVNQRRGHVTLCARRPIVWTVRAADNADDDIGLSFHSHPLVSVMYSAALHQLVSLDNSGLVLVSEFHDGKTCYRFNITNLSDESRESDITCSILNVGQRELLVGFANGRISAYNFNNGFLLNHYITGSNGPILTMEVSEHGDKRGSMIFASGVDGCVWMWISAVTDRPTDIIFEKKFRLSADRPDFDIDVVSIAYHRSGILATGRQDGRVLLWSPSDGRLKKDLVDDLFTKIDTDSSGAISYGEMSEYLREENYTNERIDQIFKKLDKDESGDITKDEFRTVLSKEGTLLIDPLTGRGFAKRNQHIGSLKFFDHNEIFLVSASANGTIAVYNAETGAFFKVWHLAEQRKTDVITCFAFIEKENLMITGDSVGSLKLYDISELHDKNITSQLSLLLNSWKAHFEAVVMLTAVQDVNLVVSCNGGQEPQIFIWSYAGELVGVAGDRHNRKWVIHESPNWSILEHLRRLARDKLDEVAVKKENEERLIRQVRSKFKKGRRFTDIRSAAYTVLNKNFFDREAVREAELAIRVKRMKLFFKLQQHHFADSMDLIEKFEIHMKQIWRKEIEEDEQKKRVQSQELEELVSRQGQNNNHKENGAKTPEERALARRKTPVPALNLPVIPPRFGSTSAVTLREGMNAASQADAAVPSSNSARDFGWHNITVQNLGTLSVDAIRQEKGKSNNAKLVISRAKKDQNSTEFHEEVNGALVYPQQPGSARRHRLENDLDALSTRQAGVGLTTALVMQISSHTRAEVPGQPVAQRRVSIFSQASMGPSPRFTPQVKKEGSSGLQSKDESSPLPISGTKLHAQTGNQDQWHERTASGVARNSIPTGQPPAVHSPSGHVSLANVSTQALGPVANVALPPAPLPATRRVEADKPKGRVWQSKLLSPQWSGGGGLGSGAEAVAKSGAPTDEMRVVAEQRLWEWSTQARWRSRLYTIQAGAVFAADLDRPKAKQIRLGGFSQRTAVRVLTGLHQGRGNCLSLEMDDGLLSGAGDTRSLLLSADDERELLRFARVLDAEVDRARRTVRDAEAARLSGGAGVRQAKAALDRIMRIEKQ